MIIGRKVFSAGNVTRYEVDYSYWLDRGRTINSDPTTFGAVQLAQAGGTPLADITVDQVTVTSDALFFFVSGGSVNEAFTVQVQVEDTLGEKVVDTILFTVTE